jgi:hypothetical protein
LVRAPIVHAVSAWPGRQRGFHRDRFTPPGDALQVLACLHGVACLTSNLPVKHILVTGGNSGIGHALCTQEQPRSCIRQRACALHSRKATPGSADSLCPLYSLPRSTAATSILAHGLWSAVRRLSTQSRRKIHLPWWNLCKWMSAATSLSRLLPPLSRRSLVARNCTHL